MNRTKIEWVRNPDGSPGFTCSPKVGCLNGCPYCYARKLLRTRLKKLYQPVSGSQLWWFPERLEQIRRHKKPAGIYLDDMSDWAADYWTEEWTRQEFETIRACPQHYFYLLTKKPENMAKWMPFPPNVWMGVSATDYGMASNARYHLARIKAPVKFLSIEPLLSPLRDRYECSFLFEGSGIDWLIIGACTGTRAEVMELSRKYLGLIPLQDHGPRWILAPPLEWVKEIVEAADAAGIPVFLKNNLLPLLVPAALMDDIFWASEKAKLRQEFPR